MSPRKATRTGLVLSGGGSKASFQIGALKYLYNVVGITPETFVGTSAGSIIATMLAQYSTHEDQARAVDTLDQMWADLSSQEELFIERSWFTKLRMHGTDLFAALTAEAKPSPIKSLTASLPKILRRENEPNTALVEQPDSADPLAVALSPEQTAPESWSPGGLISLLSNLGKLSRAGGDLPHIWQSADKTKSAYRPGPLLARLLDPQVFTGARVASSGMTLRIAMVDLISGELRYMRQDGVMVDRNDVPLDQTSHDLAVGVLASCSLPAVFPPVRIGDETYVDGGVRENLPAEMAIGQLHSSPTYVVAAAPPGVPFDPSYADTDILSIMMRSTSILTDESLRDEAAYARSAGAVMIEPEIEVHDVLTVDPQLIQINKDYGWIRAAEAVLKVTAAEEALHRRIIELRLELHNIETMITGGEDEEVSVRRVEARAELDEAIALARPCFLPPGSETW